MCDTLKTASTICEAFARPPETRSKSIVSCTRLESETRLLKGGIRVGLFGLGISPTALITPENFKGITYNDPVAVSRNMVQTLRDEQRCALVVCMSHLGYPLNGRPSKTIDDQQLAAQVDGIDFIASGHSHLFMEKPVEQTQPCGAKTLIFQVGKSGINVGRVDFTFRTGKLLGATGRVLNLANDNG